MLLTTLAAFAAGAVPIAPGIASLNWQRPAASPTPRGRHAIVSADPQLPRVRRDRGGRARRLRCRAIRRPRPPSAVSPGSSTPACAATSIRWRTRRRRPSWRATTARPWPRRSARSGSPRPRAARTGRHCSPRGSRALGKNTALRCAELQARQATGARRRAMDRRRAGAVAQQRQAAAGELRCGVRCARREGRPDAGAALGAHRQGRRRMATRRDAQRRARPARGRRRARQRLRRVLRSRRTRARWTGPRPSAAAASPRTGSRGWPSRCRWPAKRNCRSTRRRSASPRRTAAACCTRPRCGRWRRTSPNRRSASTPCRRPPTTSACTNGARARRWRAPTGAAALAAIRKMGDKQRSDSRWQYFEARLPERTGDKAGGAARCIAKPRDKAEFHGFLAADRIDAPYALCPWQPGDADARPRRRRARSRRSCARWSCTASTAAAGRRANGTTR